VSQFAVAFVYSLVVGAKLTLASCIHLHWLTFDSQSCVCNSCVFSQFSHLGDRKTPILTIKKTRTRTFKLVLTEELGKGNNITEGIN
jgi:hypothetical protein